MSSIHSRAQKITGMAFVFTILLISAALLAGCAAPQATEALIQVSIFADGEQQTVELPAGSTVEEAVDMAGIKLGPLDRVEPAVYTVVGPGDSMKVVRVTETFEVELKVLPFKRQILHNESLADEVEILIQPGKNGQEEITYRRVLEDGSPISSERIPIKSVRLQEPVNEIVMVGIQAPFFPIKIPGQMFYIRDGSAWVIEGTTGNRQAIITTGDLDGRVFSISDDRSWILFSRHSEEEGTINSLWAMDLTTEGGKLVELKVPNIVHFADWVPGSSSKVVFSTVEPRSTAPGWQANNDLRALTFSKSGWTTKWTTILEANSGGVYGWWGMSFRWDPDGKLLSFTRPDSIGLLNYLDGTQTTRAEIIPYQTRGDWAWVPGLTWGPDGKVLYAVNHVVPPGSTTPEESQQFDLMAVPLEAGGPVNLVSQVGMFAYPVTSPLMQQAPGEIAYQVAYLQAILPSQSETSRYRVAVVDRDGSDKRVLFPDEGVPGLSPQRDWGAWSPEVLPESGELALAVIYEGNLWIVNPETGEHQQVTGDGRTTRVIWK